MPKPTSMPPPLKAMGSPVASPAAAPASSTGAAHGLRAVESAESLDDGDAALLDFEDDGTAAAADYTEEDFDKEMLDMEAMLATS